MDLQCDNSFIVQAIDALSPSCIVSSPVLLSRFYAFIDRCTEIERELLLLPLSSPGPPVPTQETSSVSACEQNPKDARRIRRIERTSGRKIATPRSTPLQWSISESSTSSPTSSESADLLVPALEVTTPPSTSSEDGVAPITPVSQTTSVVASVPSFGAFLDSQNFFQGQLGPRCSRASYLVRAVSGFMEGMNLDPERFKNIWCARSKIFLGSGTGPIARFRRLYNGLLRIQRSREDYDCASRLCHIFLEHDLEQLLNFRSFRTSRGRGRMTAALAAQAASISTTVAALKADRKAGRGYLQLLMESGPGLLLLVGSHVHTIWERKLTKGDISLLLQYLNQYRPEVIEKGRSLNKLATQLILNGFIAYGWTYPELNGIRSKLLDQLALYVDLSQLAMQEVTEQVSIDDDITSWSPVFTNTLTDEGSVAIEEWSYYQNHLMIDETAQGIPQLQSDSPRNAAFTEFPTTYTEFPATYIVNNIPNQMLLEEHDEGAILFDSPVYSYGL
ncbi:hypothetical protein OIDMADRAFT_46792 [Oidiodendron maius Zn]|uniref:Uncharacterized protein n=1 Tax=Oidiodendron maius (strain Zn) TaxID=913774 RepID=A0A0C3DXM7_OIDMZ|nr:hypothetical protein OIDMADRAFT_46792 [Oidiodendron maius Zn]